MTDHEKVAAELFVEGKIVRPLHDAQHIAFRRERQGEAQLICETCPADILIVLARSTWENDLAQFIGQHLLHRPEPPA